MSIEEKKRRMARNFAITEHITLLSSDQKFPFYRNQGLELIEY